MAKRKKAALDRDRDDIGRVFAALFGDSAENPRVIAERYVSSDLHHTINTRPLPFDVHLQPLILETSARVMLGGGGVVLQCANREIPTIKYALKVVRPSLISERLSDAAEEQKRGITEFINHAPLAHANIARVFGAGQLTLTHATGVRLETRPILMEWIDGATPLSAYLAQSTATAETVVDLLASCFDALAHLHLSGLIHWDVKSDNFLVDSRGVPRLTDIGNARRINAETDLVAFSTIWNLPPGLAARAPESPEPISSRRTPVVLPDRSWDSPWIDLWMLGRELNRLLGADSAISQMDRADGLFTSESLAEHCTRSEQLQTRAFVPGDSEAQYVLRCLRLVLKRILYPKGPQEPAVYLDAASVAADLRKLHQPLGAAHGIQELQTVPQQVMRLPISGNVAYTRRVAALYNSKFLQRLNNHLQLGTLAHVFPGATHRRGEHSAGVFAMAGEYLRALYANRTEPFWRLATERRDIDALLFAALVHDVGHVSYGHFIEEMDGLVRGRTHEDYVSLLLAEHEPGDATERLRDDRRELRDVASLWSGGTDDVQRFLDHVGCILSPDTDAYAAMSQDSVLLPNESEQLKLQILHTIIDSAIDADKLDYLLRDGHHCNVSYAKGIDITRFLQCLTPVVSLPKHDGRSRLHACVGVSEKGVAPVETILIARYQMFSSVYWQHTARAETAMLQFLVQEYVGASGEGEIERLDELLNRFRDLSDRQALRWLRKKLATPDLIRNVDLKAVLTSACEGLLGDRKQVYWRAFELRYEPANGQALQLMKFVINRAEELRVASSPREYVERARTLRKSISERLGKRLGVAFRPGDVLVDTPPAGKDQISNIFVVMDDSVKAVQELSPIAKSVREAFRYWVRKFRVFLSPVAAKQCADVGLTEDRVHAAIWVVLHQLRRESDPQYSLALKTTEPIGLQ